MYMKERFYEGIGLYAPWLKLKERSNIGINVHVPHRSFGFVISRPSDIHRSGNEGR